MYAAGPSRRDMVVAIAVGAAGVLVGLATRSSVIGVLSAATLWVLFGLLTDMPERHWGEHGIRDRLPRRPPPRA